MTAVEAARSLSPGVASVLTLTGRIEIWHLTLVRGVADGFSYRAYSTLRPSILPAAQLLAADGVEGMLRPIVMQAAGPAAASAAIASSSPGVAFALIATAQVLAMAFPC